MDEEQELIKALRDAKPDVALSDIRRSLIHGEINQRLRRLNIQGAGVNGQGGNFAIQRKLINSGLNDSPSDAQRLQQSGKSGGLPVPDPIPPDPPEDISCCCGAGDIFDIDARNVEMVVSGVSVGGPTSCMTESQAGLYDDEYSVTASVNGSFLIHLNTVDLNCDSQSCHLLGESIPVGEVTHIRKAPPENINDPRCTGTIIDGPNYFPVVWEVKSFYYEDMDTFEYHNYFEVRLLLPMRVPLVGWPIGITPMAIWTFNCDGTLDFFQKQDGDDEYISISNPATAITFIPPA